MPKRFARRPPTYAEASVGNACAGGHFFNYKYFLRQRRREITNITFGHSYTLGDRITHVVKIYSF